MDATSGQGRPFDSPTDTALGEAGVLLPSAEMPSRLPSAQPAWSQADWQQVAGRKPPRSTSLRFAAWLVCLTARCCAACPADRTLASSRRDEPTYKEQQVAAEVAAEAVRPGAAALPCFLLLWAARRWSHRFSWSGEGCYQLLEPCTTGTLRQGRSQPLLVALPCCRGPLGAGPG